MVEDTWEELKNIIMSTESKYLNEQYKYDCIECYKDIDAYQIYMSKYL